MLHVREKYHISSRDQNRPIFSGKAVIMKQVRNVNDCKNLFDDRPNKITHRSEGAWGWGRVM